MARRILIVRRRGGLFNVEIGLVALAAGYEAVIVRQWPWWAGLAAFFGTIAGLVLLFFSSRFLMYVLASLFSLGWGAFAFRLLYDGSGPTPHLGLAIVGAALAGGLSMWTHKRTFDAFNSDQAEVVDEL